MGWFWGCAEGHHEFVDVYDEEPNPVQFSMSELNGQNLRELFVIRKHLKFVCKHCGKEIKR